MGTNELPRNPVRATSIITGTERVTPSSNTIEAQLRKEHEGNGKLFILIPGFRSTTDRIGQLAEMRALTGSSLRYNALQVDYSDSPSFGDAVKGLTSSINTVVEKHGPQNVVVMGSSFGCALAWELLHDIQKDPLAGITMEQLLLVTPVINKGAIKNSALRRVSEMDLDEARPLIERYTRYVLKQDSSDDTTTAIFEQVRELPDNSVPILTVPRVRVFYSPNDQLVDAQNLNKQIAQLVPHAEFEPLEANGAMNHVIREDDWTDFARRSILPTLEEVFPNT